MKLEDIPKKSIFTAPDGYFEQLPGKIQKRIEGKKTHEMAVIRHFRLQYVVPLLLLALTLVWFFRNSPATSAESILATVETEDMIAYLNSSELTTEEVMDEVEFNAVDIEDIELEVYQLQLDDDTFDELVQETQGDSLL